MKVCLYSGLYNIVAKSGVGQALLHQKAMLESVGAIVTQHLDKSADIVHFNTVFPDSVIAALYARMLNKKIVYYGHSTMEDFRNSFKTSNLFAPLFKQWIKFCYSLGDVIITPTEYSAEILHSYGIKKPIFPLSNGIDTKFFSPNAERRRMFRDKYGLSDGDKAVISVGHYIERKGIIDFIGLARRLPSVRFFWFGYTNLNIVPSAVKKAIETAPKNVIFPGYVTREELRDAYCGCDLFDFMSYEETEGIVVLEALACGIPAIVRDIPVYDGWLTDDVNIYKAKDDDSFFNLTDGYLGGKLPSLNEQGRIVADERSIRNMGMKLLKIYSHK